MSFMSKVLGVFGFLGESMFGSMIGALKSAIPQVRVGVAGTKESRKLRDDEVSSESGLKVR